MPLNFALGGKTYDTVAVEIIAEEIERYAAASGDPNPAHQPGPDQVAPGVFPVVPVFRHMMSIGADPDLGVDNPGMIVHGLVDAGFLLWIYARPDAFRALLAMHNHFIEPG